MRSPILCAPCAFAVVMLSVVARAQHEHRPQPEQIATWIRQLQDESLRVRQEAAEKLGTCEGDEILPAILQREKDEQDFHVRLALAYARACQGDKQGVEILIDSLKETGHAGHIYLTRLSRVDLKWDPKEWREWLDGKSDDDFKRLVARHRQPTKERYGGLQEISQAKSFLHENGDLRQAEEMFRHVAEKYPKSEYGEEAAEFADLLAQQQREWQDYERRPRKPLSQRSPRERADELVFLLRTQQGRQMSNPGRCDIFWDPRGEESPGALLVKMGFDAIPSLIDALDDRQPTRSAGWGLWPIYLLRVNECAIQVLERMAGRSFETRGADRAIDFVATRRKVEAWWLRAQADGEEVYLVRATKRGSHQSPEMAKLLAARYPNAVEGAIREGIANAENDSVRVSFVWVLDGLADDRGVDQLKHLVAEGKTRGIRVQATLRLAHRKLLDPVPILIQEWQTNRQGPGGDISSQDSVSAIIGHLAGSDAPEGIAALADGVLKRSLKERLCIALATLPARGGGAISGAFMPPEMPAKVVCSPETLAEMEWLLIDLLEDTETHAVVGQWSGIKLNRPRTCDVAATALALRFPDKYKFDIQAAADERERSLVVIKNTWRATRGEPTMPLPEVREVAVVPAATIQPWIDKLSQDSGPDARREALAQLESLGIGALGVLEAQQNNKDVPNRVREDLTTIATRLANCVERIEWRESSADPGIELRKRLDDLLHKPLTSESLVAVFREVIRNDPGGPGKVDLLIERPTGGKGVEMSIEVSKPNPPAVEAAIGWDHEFNFVGEVEDLGSSQGYAARDYLEGSEGFARFAEQMNKLLSLPPEEYYQAKLVFGRAD